MYPLGKISLACYLTLGIPLNFDILIVVSCPERLQLRLLPLKRGINVTTPLSREMHNFQRHRQKD